MKKILKGILFSIITLAVGFAVMAAPFHLFTELTGMEMRILFIGEIIVYFAIFSIVMLIREKKQGKKFSNHPTPKKRTQSFLDMQNQIAEPYSDYEESVPFTKAA